MVLAIGIVACESLDSPRCKKTNRDIVQLTMDVPKKQRFWRTGIVSSEDRWAFLMTRDD